MLRVDAVNPSDRGERIGAVAACAAALALFLPFVWPLASGRVFQGDDLGRFHLPTRHFYAQCLANGDDYRWHPGLFCGVYLHGEGQAGMDHPLHRLLFATLPLAAAFQIELAIGYPLMFAGMGLWLRRLGLRSDASFFGAMVFTFSAFMFLRYVHMNAIEVTAHLPWLLLGIEILARPRSDREAAWAGCGIAILTASQGLLGYPQYLGFCVVVEVLYATLRFRWSAGTWLRWAIAKGLGLLAAGAQILPHADALAGSMRATPTRAFLGMNSLQPMNLARIVVPFAFRQGHYRADAVAAWPFHENVAYLGAVVPASLAWLWIRRRDLGRWRPMTIGAAGLLAASLALAMGSYSPLFRFYAAIPAARIVRAPSRYVVVAQMAAAVLCAVAFADLANMASRRIRLPRRSLRPLLAPIAASVAVGAALLLARDLRPAGFRADQIGVARDMAASAIWLALPCLVMALSARGWRAAPLALILLAAADSAVVAVAPILRHERTVDPADPAITGPAAPSSSRVISRVNEAAIGGTRLVEGYVAMTPRRHLDYTKPRVLQVASAGWDRADGGAWRALSLAPLPRARLVAHAAVSRDPGSDLERIDVGTTALVDAPLDLPAGPAGEATIVRDRPGDLVIQTKAGARRLLAVSESFHPGWGVEIDGQPAIPLRVNGDFLGCVIEAGRHDVRLRFDPSSSRVGRRLTMIGLAAIGLQLIGGLWRSRRPAREHERSGRWGSLTSGRRCDEIRPFPPDRGDERQGST
ncbi:MAG: Bacterial rane protein YfhO [Planctomycetota bacterium]|nr:Bacterial rane protein YfhO [Planctomycetota bacterium]